MPNHLSLTQSAKRFILWRSFYGKWTIRRALPSSAILETARCSFADDCCRRGVVRRASVGRARVGGATAADRGDYGFGQSQAESGNLASRVGVQPIAEGCGDRGDAIVRLHGRRTSLSADPASERFPVEVQVSTWGLPSGYQEKVVGLTVSSEGVRWQEVAIIRLEVVN